MAVSNKRKSFAALCVSDHKQVIAREIRKIAKENGWLIAQMSEHSKTSTATVSYVLRGDEYKVSLDRLCLMAYELGIAIGMRIVNPNA